MHKHSGDKRGDTLIEVMFSVGVFGLVAVGSVGIMNRGLYTAQNSLEITMARNEIDAQAEALRFIHAAYTAEKNANTPEDDNYTAVWNQIVKKNISRDESDAPAIDDLSGFINDYDNLSSPDKSCSNLGDSKNSNSFVVNYRQLRDIADPTNPFNASSVLSNVLEVTPTHPRLFFGTSTTNEDEVSLDTEITSNSLMSAQGIWVTTVRDASSREIKKIQYFDFYIRTCWDRLGGGSPNTISTVIRLYNPDYEADI